MERTRLVVGVDLGTTNTALAYVDRQTGKQARTVRDLELPQLTDPGVVRPLPTLPSAVWVRGAHELSSEQVALPWDPQGASPTVVGALARARGALGASDRIVTSAKSWLCHPGVDRKGKILPWGAPDEVQKRSPVDVQALILGHVRAAWDAVMAKDDERKQLARADLVVTLPASFDEVARELTVEAARQAGLPDALFIEEPTAALYAWIAAHERDWPEKLKPGETILVADVGGGTTDFSLIHVVAGAKALDPEKPDDDAALEPPSFERVAVGEHLLLGGDNMDLALARTVEQRINRRLEAREWHGVVQACRDAKEKLLSGAAEKVQIAVAGRGSKLIGATLRAELGRAEVEAALLEGFFPRVAQDESLARRTAGLAELGLPFEAEPAVTRHLRRFLGKHGAGPGPLAGGETSRQLAHVDHVLFNGGVFKTKTLRDRVLEVVASWQPGRPPRELEATDLDLAVARGAAYYGLVRRGKGTRIKSGAGRAYYVEVGGAQRTALCLVPRGAEEGAVTTIGEPALEVRANAPVAFPFLSSTTRSDAPGALVKIDPGKDDLEELAPLHTVLRAGKATQRLRTLPVELVSRYTELGTLEVWLQEKNGERRFRLELDTRGAHAPPSDEGTVADEGDEVDRAGDGHAPDEALPPGVVQGAASATVSPDALEKAKRHLLTALRRPAGEARALESLSKELEELLGGAREAWPVPVIRALYDALIEETAARKRSPQHEARWLNLAGFFLRPGFGAAVDFDRVARLWKVFLEGPVHGNKEAVALEWLVTFRRVSGGLKPGQQEALFAKIQPKLLGHERGDKQEVAELWRLAASLELLGPKKKKQLGDLLLEQLEKGKGPPRWGPWALGRFGGRVPLYGPLDRLVPADVAGGWAERLAALGLKGDEVVFGLVQLVRRTGDRSRDVPDLSRMQARAALEKLGVEPRALRLLDEVVTTETRIESEFYGDSVPVGLVISGAHERPPC